MAYKSSSAQVMPSPPLFDSLAPQQFWLETEHGKRSGEANTESRSNQKKRENDSDDSEQSPKKGVDNVSIITDNSTFVCQT